MRSALILVILISMLIVGFLVIKDMNTKSVDGLDKKEIIKQAEKAVGATKAALKKITDANKIMDSE